jgi:hypothetical protein
MHRVLQRWRLSLPPIAGEGSHQNLSVARHPQNVSETARCYEKTRAVTRWREQHEPSPNQVPPGRTILIIFSPPRVARSRSRHGDRRGWARSPSRHASGSARIRASAGRDRHDCFCSRAGTGPAIAKATTRSRRSKPAAARAHDRLCPDLIARETRDWRTTTSNPRRRWTPALRSARNPVADEHSCAPGVRPCRRGVGWEPLRRSRIASAATVCPGTRPTGQSGFVDETGGPP